MSTLKSLIKRGMEQEEIIELMEDELSEYLETGHLSDVSTEWRHSSTTVVCHSPGRKWFMEFRHDEPESIFLSSALDGSQVTDPKIMKSVGAVIKYISRVAGI